MPGLPPIPDVDTLNLGRLLLNMALAIAWTAVAGLCFAVAISLGLRLLAALVPEASHRIQMRLAVTVEIEAEAKPALVADWLTVLFLAPS